MNEEYRTRDVHKKICRVHTNTAYYCLQTAFILKRKPRLLYLTVRILE